MNRLRIFAALVLLPLVAVPPSFAWGNEGHRLINRLAAEKLPADMPAFLHTTAAVNEIEYLGPEPDRWRGRLEPELVSAQAPDHFLDIELTESIKPLPHNRYAYIAALYGAIAAHPERAKELAPEHVGFQPWQTTEVYERLEIAFREWRKATAGKQDTSAIEATILFYAGWLGHYVADGSQPLHTTVNYNGWVAKENPNNYTTKPIHWTFEGPFVGANAKQDEVAAKMAPVRVVTGDIFDSYMAYLRTTNSFVEKTYQLEKNDGYIGAGSAEARAFMTERLAAGASELRDLIYSAWLASATPEPPAKY